MVSTRQLVAIGLTRQAIAKRVTAARLHRVERGVYAVGHDGLIRNGRLLAAVLSCGDDAAISHRAAAALWGLIGDRSLRIDVTVPGGARSPRRLIVIHRSVLSAADKATVEGIPVTSPARTITDLADFRDRRLVEKVIDEAHFLGLDLTGLEPVRGRRGAGVLAAVLREHEPGSTRTRSNPEELMLALCRRERLPHPRVNAIVEGYEVDFSWPEKWLIVEVDHRQSHSTPGAFEWDRKKDADLTVAGWRVIRVTDRRLKTEPRAVARQLRELLA